MQTIPTNVNQLLANFSQLDDAVNLRPKYAAPILAVSTATFYRLARDGKIVTRKLTSGTTVISVGELRRFMAGE